MSGFLFALIFDIESILMMIDAFLRDFIMVQKYVMVGVGPWSFSNFRIWPPLQNVWTPLIYIQGLDVGVPLKAYRQKNADF